MRALILTLFFVLGTAVAYAEVPLPQSREETLRLLYDALKASAPDADLRLNEGDQSIETYINGEKTLTSYVDNLFITLQATPDSAERQDTLNQFVHSFKATLAEMSAPGTIAAPEQVMPVVRSIAMQSALAESDAPMRPFVGDLLVYWVVDQPESISSLTNSMADMMELSPVALANLGQENLIARLPDLHAQPMDYGLTMLLLDGNYESSFLLLDTLWNDLAQQFGQVVVAVPARDLLIYADGDNTDAVASLRDIAERSDFSYPLTRNLLVWTTKGWQVLP